MAASRGPWTPTTQRRELYSNGSWTGTWKSQGPPPATPGVLDEGGAWTGCAGPGPGLSYTSEVAAPPPARPVTLRPAGSGSAGTPPSAAPNHRH